MGYAIKRDDIILFKKKLYSVYKVGGDTATLLPVRESGRGYVVSGNARSVSARDLERSAIPKGNIINEKLD